MVKSTEAHVKPDLGVAKPTGLFAFGLCLSLMALWNIRCKQLRLCVLQRASGCVCVCPFVVAMRVWLLWCVAALHWKWLANVAKFLVAAKEVGLRFVAGKVLDPVALATKEKS